MRFHLWTTTCLAGLLLSQAHAQEISTADLEIMSITHAVGLTAYQCELVVRNVNDDTAYDVQVVVLLPNHVKVTSTSPPCVRGTPIGGWNGFVRCSLGNINPANVNPANPAARRTIRITTTLPKALGDKHSRACAAFAWSRTGDHRRGNNFKISE